jgi:hypothetical protein|tara:strand:+ start:3200 stop:4039 length:840 start_codon:yes stop_codon:yes gene_type:complete
MATITLRATKGSPLTNTEVDNNFTNLNNDKYESGDSVAVAALTATGNLTLSTAATVTAAGTTQGGGTAITKTYNIISTANANQGVVLPAALVGKVINVYNISGNTIKVYPASGEAIDGGSANAPVEIVDDNGKELVGTGTGSWRAVGSGGNNVQDFIVNGSASLLGSLTYGVEAISAAGSNQGDATAIAETISIITSATAAQGVKLPTAAAGLHISVQNTTSADIILYPNTSDKIDGGTANAGVALPANTTTTVTCKDAVDWIRHRGLAVYNSSGALIN